MLIPPAVNWAGLNSVAGRPPSPALGNGDRIHAVAEGLAGLFMSGVGATRKFEFYHLCLELSRCIDYAVHNNEIPRKVQVLPLLLKQICQLKNDPYLRAALMILMISVKNVCKIGWFPAKEVDELYSLANELGEKYCSLGNVNTGPCTSPISSIMERFYPCMKIGKILAFLEVQPGYGTFMVDFHISKNTAYSPKENIRLFVAQTNNIETSACIISPQQVNFLLNGEGVKNRTIVHLDPGPQVPTDITNMLKCGTNLLQAVGQFNGHYLILVAFMSVTSSSKSPMLQDYVRPCVAETDSDSEIVEGASRISLNCPISYTRINTPVKGRSCKHLQCFDFNNFVDINLRRPSWRCPHCNQYVCYLDICVDRNMVEVLKDVGKDVAVVIICADGSWKAVMENAEQAVENTQNNVTDPDKEQIEPSESMNCDGARPNLLDLTEDDGQMDATELCMTKDVKPSHWNCRSQPVIQNSTLSMNSTVGVNQNAAIQLEDSFWSGLYFANASASSSGGLDSLMVGTPSGHNPSNLTTPPPILTNATSPVLNHEDGVHGNACITNCGLQSQYPSLNTIQPEQYSNINSVNNNEYVRSSLVQREITRAPTAVQALPLPSHAMGLQQMLSTSLNSIPSSSSAITSPVSVTTLPISDSFGAMLSDIERQQHFSRPQLSLPSISEIASSAMRYQSTAQGQAPQVAGVPTPSQFVTAYRTPSSRLSDLQNPHLQQALRLYQASSAMSSHLPRTVGAQVGMNYAAGSSGNQNLRINAQVGRQSSTFSVQNQTNGTHSSLAVQGLRASAVEHRTNQRANVEPVSRNEDVMDLQSQQNWRPTGRMRGSLTGSAISTASHDHVIIQPTQSVRPSQSTRPPLLPPCFPSQQP